eukprot:Sspe_Gene.77534::Locus_48457_Transcript_1_1_Confidence_1.000_Length_1918::g.77534::m.77534
MHRVRCLLALSAVQPGVLQTPDGGWVVTPPVGVLPPKRLLWSHDADEVTAWYSHKAQQRKEYGKALGGTSTAEKRNAALTVEHLAGLLATCNSRLRHTGTCLLGTSNVVVNEQDSTKRLYRFDADEVSMGTGGDGGYVEVLLRKNAVTDEEWRGVVRKTFGVRDDEMGWHSLGESGGVGTQPLYIPRAVWEAKGIGAKHAKLRGRKLTVESSFAGSKRRDRAWVQLGRATLRDALPVDRGCSQRCYVTVNDIPAGLQSIEDELDRWRSRGYVFNGFSPSAFALPYHTAFPSWVVGWHATRWDPVHLVLATLLHNAPPTKALRGLLHRFLATPCDAWHSCDVAGDLLHVASHSPHAPWTSVLKVLLRHRNPDFEAAATTIATHHSGWLGEACASFLCLVWNMLASARLAHLPHRPVWGDLVARNGVISCFTQGPEEASLEENPVRLTDVVLPLADLGLCDARLTRWPSHIASLPLAANILTTFQVTPTAVARIHAMLPADFRSTKYRKLCVPITDVDYVVSPAPLELDPDALSRDTTLKSHVRTKEASAASTNISVAFDLPLGSSPLSAIREMLLLGL